jgi:hypothetical protein
MPIIIYLKAAIILDVEPTRAFGKRKSAAIGMKDIRPG